MTDFDEWTRGVERQIHSLADRRTFRFRATRRDHAAQYLAAMRACRGLTDSEIVELEAVLALQLPAAYRAFLRRFGKARGHLFRGSDVEPRDLARHGADAAKLIATSEPLPAYAIVFLFHQGYTFCWLGQGDDPPVTQFIEGEGYRPCAERFTSFIDAELVLMEEVNITARERGGTFLTVTPRGVTEVFPAQLSGIRPLDADDELI